MLFVALLWAMTLGAVASPQPVASLCCNTSGGNYCCDAEYCRTDQAVCGTLRTVALPTVRDDVYFYPKDLPLLAGIGLLQFSLLQPELGNAICRDVLGGLCVRRVK